MTRAEILDDLIDIIGTISKYHNIYDESFEMNDLNFDETLFFEFSLHIDLNFDIVTQLSQVAECATIGEVIDLIEPKAKRYNDDTQENLFEELR